MSRGAGHRASSTFIGEANHLQAEWRGKSLISPLGIIDVPAEIGEKTKVLMVRPEDIFIESATEKDSNGKIKSIDFAGSTQTIVVQLKNGEQIQISEPPHFSRLNEDFVKITIRRFLCFNNSGEKIRGFPPEGTLNLSGNQ